jgi:hypothetical protein
MLGECSWIGIMAVTAVMSLQFSRVIGRLLPEIRAGSRDESWGQVHFAGPGYAVTISDTGFALNLRRTRK